MSKSKTLFLIDGHALAYRMFFAFQKQNLTADGKPTGAVYGFVTSVLRLLDTHKPDYFGVVFDPHGPTFRNEMYQDYKATRQKMPPELAEQIPMIRDVLTAMTCAVVEAPRYEADDVIGTLAKRFEAQDITVVLYTSDKDYMQLVSERVKMLKPGLKGNDDSWIGIPEVKEKFGVEPGRVIDALAMIGDTSDNIPGVDGVGEKTAAELLAVHGSLDAILANPAGLKSKRAREFLSKPINIDLIQLSRQLVTIDLNAPVSYVLEDFKLPQFNNKVLFELFKKLQFRSLLSRFIPKELSFDFNAAQPVAAAAYPIIDSWEKFGELTARLRTSGGFAFDTETTDENPHLAQIVGISFAVKAGEAWYIPLGHVEKGTFGANPKPLSINLDAAKVWAELKLILEDPAIPKIGHNIKFDAQVLQTAAGVTVQPQTYDTMVMAWILDPNRRQNGLKDLTLELLSHQMRTYAEVVGKGKDQLNFAEVDVPTAAVYCGEDSDYTYRLKDLLLPKLNETGLDRLFHDLEMPLVPVLATMERHGVSIDPVFFEEMSLELTASMRELETRIYHVAGETFNINSPKQLQEILFHKLMLPVIRKTPKGDPSTDADVLEELGRKHDLPAKIIEFRELAKLKGTYVDALPKMINPRTGRLHTTFNQAVAPTGRLASSDPGLQNIPIRTEIGRRIRKGFIVGPGYDYILSADYSQIELRVLAHYAKDEALIQAFKNGEDIHARTAAAVNGCDLSQVTPEMRRTAKATNFGIVYGQTAFGLSNSLGITVSEATKFIDLYFKTYPGVKNYIQSAQNQAAEKGYVTTLYGRRRPLPDIFAKNRSIRQYAERTAINTPIQGSAADMIKLAMLGIQRELDVRRLKSRMILQVHDELLFETTESELETLRKLVVETMENVRVVRDGDGCRPLDVPVKADTGVGKNWLEAH